MDITTNNSLDKLHYETAVELANKVWNEIWAKTGEEAEEMDERSPTQPTMSSV